METSNLLVLQQRVIFSENTQGCYETRETGVDSKKERKKKEKEKEKLYMKQKKEENMQEVSLEIAVFTECLVILYYVLTANCLCKIICEDYL